MSHGWQTEKECSFFNFIYERNVRVCHALCTEYTMLARTIYFANIRAAKEAEKAANEKTQKTFSA